MQRYYFIERLQFSHLTDSDTSTSDLKDMYPTSALMVTAECDWIFPSETTICMGKYIPQLEVHNVKGAGHWLLWEKPDQCNRILEDWLTGKSVVDQMKLE